MLCVGNNGSARSGSHTVLDFSPTADFPSLQYFDVVEKHSQADLAGLRSGDFLLQVRLRLIINHSICIFTGSSSTLSKYPYIRIYTSVCMYGLLGLFHGAIAVPSVTRCRCRRCGHRTPPAL